MRPGVLQLAGVALLLGFVLLAAAGTSAQAVELGLAVAPRHRLSYTSLTALQWNPLGVQTELTLSYRRRLFDSPRLLLSDTHVGALLVARVNPAFARLGGGVELRPLAVLGLQLLYEQHLYYGTARMLQSFVSPGDAHSDQTLGDRATAGVNYASHGHQLTARAVVRAKVGPIALYDELDLVYHRMDLRGGDRVFYVNYFDTLTPNNNLLLMNTGHLVTLRGPLILGVRHTLVHAFYPAAWLAGGPNPNTPHHRLGPIVCYTFRDRGPRFRAPTLILIVNWWIGSRYRAGDIYGVAALQFSGDLWSR